MGNVPGFKKMEKNAPSVPANDFDHFVIKFVVSPTVLQECNAGPVEFQNLLPILPRMQLSH